jgi:hypothetical protein
MLSTVAALLRFISRLDETAEALALVETTTALIVEEDFSLTGEMDVDQAAKLSLEEFLNLVD